MTSVKGTSRRSGLADKTLRFLRALGQCNVRFPCSPQCASKTYWCCSFLSSAAPYPSPSKTRDLPLGHDGCQISSLQNQSPQNTALTHLWPLTAHLGPRLFPHLWAQHLVFCSQSVRKSKHNTHEGHAIPLHKRTVGSLQLCHWAPDIQVLQWAQKIEYVTASILHPAVWGNF